MSPELRPSRAVRFGVFEVNLAARELRKHGVRLRIGGHPFEILALLLERPGEVLTRARIREQLWPADTFVDFEHGLNAAVNRLRKVLGDSPDNSRYVETLPRVGYRFVAPVETVGNGSAHPVPVTEFATHPPSTETYRLPQLLGRRTARRKWILALLGLLGGLSVATGVSNLVPSPKPRVLRSYPLTNTARIDAFGRVTSDGLRLFFIERQGGHWNLMQQSISGGEAQTFSQPFHNARVMSVSPDSSELLLGEFDERGPVRLWLVSAIGGQPRRVGGIVADDAVFTQDGKEITYSTDEGIYVVDFEGAHARRIFGGAGAKDFLVWSPDGGTLRFSWFVGETMTQWEVAKDGSNPHPLLPGWNPSPQECCGRWTADGRYYIFVSYRSDGGAIWALQEKPPLFRARLREPVQLTAGPIPFYYALPAADGKRLFALGSNEQEELVQYEPATRQIHPLLAGIAAFDPSYSPDGQLIAFQSGPNLWVSRPDGTDKKQLTGENGQPRRPHWSPDGKEILYIDRMPTGTHRMFTIPATGGASRELHVGALNPGEAVFSSDGKTIAFDARSDDNPAEEVGLYLLDRKTGLVRTIAGSEGLAKPSFSPNGRYLGAESDDNDRIMLLDLRTSRWKEIRKGTAFGPLGWSRDSQYLYFQDLLEENQPIWRMNVDRGSFERVTDFRVQLEGSVSRCGLEAVAPDGSPVIRMTSGDNNLYVLDVDLP